MCRFLGIISAESIPYRILLREIPRSLSSLSKEHFDGWGIAVYRSSLNPEDKPSDSWAVYKGIQSAEKDQTFHEISSKISGEILISHVRRRTVGPVSLENTHPFEREGWVFAHNGTIKDRDYLRNGISSSQLKKLRGETDSELFLTFLLSRWEEKGISPSSADERIEEVLKEVVQEVSLRTDFGELNFLLSNGSILYTYRLGPKHLYLLERGPHEGVRYRVSIEDGKTLQIPWTKRRHALFIASEKMTHEPWVEIEEKTLIRIDRLPKPTWRAILRL
jgi:predicted glutamine amidotransferase